MNRKLKISFVIFVISILLVMPIVSHAAPHTEETTTSEEETPAGIGEFFLLIGLAGITVVGGARIGREMSQNDNN